MVLGVPILKHFRVVQCKFLSEVSNKQFSQNSLSLHDMSCKNSCCLFEPRQLSELRWKSFQL